MPYDDFDEYPSQVKKLREEVAALRAEVAELRKIAEDTAADLDVAYDALMDTDGGAPIINVFEGGTIVYPHTYSA